MRRVQDQYVVMMDVMMEIDIPSDRACARNVCIVRSYVCTMYSTPYLCLVNVIYAMYIHIPHHVTVIYHS